MAEQISYREFGRRVGLSGEGVRKAIATGRIPPEFIGETILSSGRARPCIVDPEGAANALGLMTNPVQQRDRVKIGKSMERAHARRRGEPVNDDADDTDGAVAPAGAGAKAGSGVPTIAQSQAVKEAYKARLAKLEYEEKSGKLVNAEQVKVQMVTMVKAAVSKLRGVPVKAKTRIPTLTVRDIEALEDLIDEALQELSSGS